MLCPSFAHKLLGPGMVTQGVYAKGWPVGAVVHFTAGHDGAANTIAAGIKQKYAYWCIQRDGALYCAHSAERWGWHCGESAWKKFAKKLVGSCNDDLIGIEHNAAGMVTKQADGSFKTWWGGTVSANEVRWTPGVDNQEKGYYQILTPNQERTLIETLMWLKAQKPDVFDFDFVLGHDEVSGPKGIGYWRKNDPGAALSMTMTAFRQKLKDEWASRQSVEVKQT